jgi:hypothetical protein
MATRTRSEEKEEKTVMKERDEEKDKGMRIIM